MTKFLWIGDKTWIRKDQIIGVTEVYMGVMRDTPLQTQIHTADGRSYVCEGLTPHQVMEMIGEVV